MSFQVIRTAEAPLPVGPYNQAIVIPANSKLIYLAGQIPLNPHTGKVETGDITIQTERVLQNIKAVLTASGAEFKDVIKTTVFLADMADFAAMNAVYGQYFLDPAPARSCVQVARLPLNVAVEIECIVAV
ncbi:endoribonuclease L-PSP, putative [Synechococcus sp. PCC 7502]|uniref:RidA family protein n=1 Tax=Synechococcus sp. PCC 7502 TaxID=1173263 RepID=UPI00029FB9B0|nr:RidA family protein [Synechococcus sp. PCC 7502]AFY73319.1 endoribonuclease L-PSP, putative [Synechococcus sp. PCC 7502]